MEIIIGFMLFQIITVPLLYWGAHLGLFKKSSTVKNYWRKLALFSVVSAVAAGTAGWLLYCHLVELGLFCIFLYCVVGTFIRVFFPKFYRKWLGGPYDRRW